MTNLEHRAHRHYLTPVLHQHIADINVRIRIVRLERSSAAKGDDDSHHVALGAQDISQIVQRHSEVGVQCERATLAFFRLRDEPQLPQRQP